jgi:hypothetical protein
MSGLNIFAKKRALGLFTFWQRLSYSFNK